MLTEKIPMIICLILFCASLSTTSSVAESELGTATGTLTWKGQTHQIKYAYALQTENPYDENKRDAFILLLADAPVTDDISRLDQSDMARLLIEKNLHGIVFGIDANNGIFSTDLPRGFSGGVAEFEPGQMKPELIEGRVHSNGIQKFIDDTYEFDIRFQAAVQAQKVIDAKNGTALPKGGGEPGKAYIAYSKALASGDLESIIKFRETTSEQLQELEKMKKESPEEFKEGMEMISAFTNKNIRILEGYTNGTEAMMTVEGVDSFSSKPDRGRVEMKLINGQWKFVHEKWDSVN
jgi:hypothetical protein